MKRIISFPSQYNFQHGLHEKYTETLHIHSC